MKNYLFAFILITLFCACDTKPKKTHLPILGERKLVDGDTVFHTIPDFTFINQDSVIITPETFAGEAYIVDYFFTSCPTICPKVKAQTLRIYDRFKENEELSFLSVSIDAKYDTIPRLKWYADKLDVDGKKWHFVTGDKDMIYEIANDFFHIAIEDASAPGGFDHDGRLILVDKNKNIRTFCDALDPESVDDFMDDLDLYFATNGATTANKVSASKLK